MQIVELAYYGNAQHLLCLVELLVDEGLSVEHNPPPTDSEASVAMSLWTGPDLASDAELLDERVHAAVSKFNARIFEATVAVRPTTPVIGLGGRRRASGVVDPIRRIHES